MAVTTSGYGKNIRLAVRRFLYQPTSANLLAMMTSKTGTGNNVFGIAPALSLPTIDNPIIGYTTTATAGATTTLTSASTYQQFFTGSLAQTIVLPVVSTLALGWGFVITNAGTGTLTVQSSGLNTIFTIPAGNSAIFICILITGTSAASWAGSYDGNSAVTGTGSSVLSKAPTIVDPVISTATALAVPNTDNLMLDLIGGT